MNSRGLTRCKNFSYAAGHERARSLTYVVCICEEQYCITQSRQCILCNWFISYGCFDGRTWRQLIGKPDNKSPVEDLGVGGRILLKLILINNIIV
jgi:hypothetical protein